VGALDRLPWNRPTSACAEHRNLLGQTFRLIIQEVIDLGYRPIEGYHCEAMVRSVQNKILAHDGQTDEAKVTTGICPRMSADVDASKTGATVSPLIYQYRPNIVELCPWMAQYQKSQ